MTDHAESTRGGICTWEAAYVLGALPAGERREFEEHLADCPRCRESVGDLAGVPGLLGRVSPDDLAPPPAVPDTLLPRLLRQVRRRTRRRTWLAASVAAAVLLVAGLALGLGLGQGGSDDGNHGPGQAMTALVAAPIKATTWLRADAGGTRIDLACTYAGHASGELPPYELVVTGRDGADHRIATWRVGPDPDTRIVGSVNLVPAQIASVEVRTGSGTPLLRLRR